jgi:hypothetical protein
MLKNVLIDLVAELERIHSPNFSWSDENSIPDIATDKNGQQILFAQEAKSILREVSKLIHSNRSQVLPKIELNNFHRIVRRVIANMFSEGTLTKSAISNDKDAIKNLKAQIEETLNQEVEEFTHYFPAWTTGIESSEPIDIGPVQLMSRALWIERVDFHSDLKESYLNLGESNYRWKELLNTGLASTLDNPEISGIASLIYDTIHECPALLSVKVKDFEMDFSRKFARIIAKCALDSLSLILGHLDLFHKQVLLGERTIPLKEYILLETDSYLWRPGFSLTRRMSSLPDDLAKSILSERADLKRAIGFILNGINSSEMHKLPKLCTRWATALDWFAEGCRELNDSVALAKIATCLDVLSGGGKFIGITKMITHFLNINEDVIVIAASKTTLRTLIKEIYDEGRSKILHGTYYDRLESFSEKRHQASHLTRAVLIKTALALEKYNGSDSDKGFRGFHYQLNIHP